MKKDAITPLFMRKPRQIRAPKGHASLPGVFAACLTVCFTRRAECMYKNLAKNIFYHVREAQPQKESFE